jgi:hypothetical protein
MPAGTAARLVSYGNAFLSGRHDAGRGTLAAVEPAYRRWRFDTLCERRGGFMPLRAVAHGPRGWFRWLRAQGYTELTLLRLSELDVMALDGPLKVFAVMRPGWFVGASCAGLPMLWDEWKSGRSGIYQTGPFKVEHRGAEVYALPVREAPDPASAAARFGAVLAEAAALEPADAPAFERARAALAAADPESLLEPGFPRLLPPVERDPARRRLAAAVLLALTAPRTSAASLRMEGLPVRPPDYYDALGGALRAAVNPANGTRT